MGMADRSRYRGRHPNNRKFYQKPPKGGFFIKNIYFCVNFIKITIDNI